MWSELWVVAFIISTSHPSLDGVTVCLWVAWCSFDQIPNCLRITAATAVPSTAQAPGDKGLRAQSLPTVSAGGEGWDCFNWLFLCNAIPLLHLSKTGQSRKSHLLAVHCLSSLNSWGQSPWDRQDNLVFRKPKSESWFHRLSINLLLKGTENCLSQWTELWNYRSLNWRVGMEMVAGAFFLVHLLPWTIAENSWIGQLRVWAHKEPVLLD